MLYVCTVAIRMYFLMLAEILPQLTTRQMLQHRGASLMIHALPYTMDIV